MIKKEYYMFMVVNLLIIIHMIQVEYFIQKVLKWLLALIYIYQIQLPYIMYDIVINSIKKKKIILFYFILFYFY